MINFEKYGIIIPYGRKSGQVKCVCPNCKDHRGNPKDKSLSVNLDSGMFKCHHCGWDGCANEEEEWEKSMRMMYGTNKVPYEKKPEFKVKLKVKGNKKYSDKLLAWFNGRGISEQTLLSFGVTEATEYMPQVDGERNCICFNYFSNGELLNIKFRDGSKNFKLISGAKLIPYNIDSTKGEEECIITEGEMDALTFFECGFKSVVSVPNGANENLTWLDDFVESHFEDKKVIYIASDTDTKGLMLRAALIRRFGDLCRIVEYGEGCKDANELLLAKGKDAVRDCISKAKELSINGEVNLADIDNALDLYYEHGTEKGLTLGYDAFDKLMSFQPGLLYVVTGVPSSGKSEFIDQICERLNWRYGWRFGVFSPENEPYQMHIGKIISKITGRRFARGFLSEEDYGKAKEVVRKAWHWISPERFTLDAILDTAKAQVRRYGINMLVIDPYNRIEIENGTDERSHIKNMLIRLRRFASDNNILVMLMAHPSKPPKEGYTNPPTLYDISGSADFYNIMDFGLVVHRNRSEENVELIVKKCRFKNLGTEGSAKFKYVWENGRYAPLFEDGSAKWDMTNHLNESNGLEKGGINEQDKAENERLFEQESGEVPF